MKISIAIILLFLVACGPPDPEPIYEVTFTNPGLFGVDVPFLEKENKVVRAKSRPVRTQLIGGTRFSFKDEYGNPAQESGAHNFTLRTVEWVDHTDPRHSQYEEQ